MSENRNTLLIEGTFRELVEELADYIDNLRKLQEGATTLRSEITPSLENYSAAEESGNSDGLDATRDEVLKTVVGNSNALISAPERGMFLIGV